MKLKKNLYLATAIILLASCGAHNRNKINYNANIIKARECVNNFYFYGSTKSLDSAYVYLTEVKDGDCADSNRLVNLHLSSVYFLKGDFKDAIKVYESLDAREFSFPEYKRILINQIKAKEAGGKKQYAKQTEYYSDILRDLDAFIDRNISTRDSVLKLQDMSSLDRLETEVLLRFGLKYYYLNKVKGSNNVILELDSLQKTINGNQAYFEFLKKSAIGKDGYHMSVEFE